MLIAVSHKKGHAMDVWTLQSFHRDSENMPQHLEDHGVFASPEAAILYIYAYEEPFVGASSMTWEQKGYTAYEGITAYEHVYWLERHAVQDLAEVIQSFTQHCPLFPFTSESAQALMPAILQQAARHSDSPQTPDMSSTPAQAENGQMRTAKRKA